MKNGLQIEIQSNLSTEEDKKARDYSNKFLKEYIEDGMKFKGTGGGWHSFYRRGTVGLRLDRDSDLYFRRASRHKRIYQIIKASEIKLTKKGEFLVTKENSHMYHYHTNLIKTEKTLENSCKCPTCSGQLKVDNKYGDTKTYIYATIGDIKG